MTSSLDMLIELGHKAQEAAAQVLAQNRQSLRHIEGQLRTLQQYNQEYRQTLQQILHKQGMSPEALANYRAFLESLDAAVDRALRSRALKQEELAKNQTHWQAQWRRAHAFETLGKRRAAEALRQANRIDQRSTDELSTRMLQRPGVFEQPSDRSL